MIFFFTSLPMYVMPSSARARGLLLVAALSLFFSTGCTRVAPYERGVLARPTMAPGQLAGPGEEHVFDVHEGATGGGSAGGGGCGCN